MGSVKKKRKKVSTGKDLCGHLFSFCLYVLFSKPQRATHSTQDNAYDGAKNAQQKKKRLLSFSGHYPLLLCQVLPTGWLPWL